MAKVISIIGLGQIGTAAVFALGRYAEHIHLQAYDPDPANRQRTLNAGAVCDMVTDLKGMIQNADVVLDCSPYTAVKKNMNMTVGALADEAIYCCCAPNKSFLARSMNGNRRFFGIVITTNKNKWKHLSAKMVLNDAELFAETSIGISTGASSEEAAIKRALDLVELLGGQGVLMDHEEADLVEDRMLINPILAAITGSSAAINEAGWGENKKFANFGFGRMLDMTGIESPEDLAAVLVDAPNGALRWIATRRNADKELESAIQTGDHKKIYTQLAGVSTEREAISVLLGRQQIKQVEESKTFFQKLIDRFVRKHA